MLDEVYTSTANSNIAFVKYWGRRNIPGNVPYNSSVSMTLDREVSTLTSVVVSKRLSKDEVYVDGELQDPSGKNEKAEFMAATIKMMREMAKADAHVLVVSKNTFPLGTGLASSASGSTALVHALSNALDLDLSIKDQSIISRCISGSACRSALGGFSKWVRGDKADWSDSSAVQVAGKEHWPELTDIIALVSQKKKRVSSSEGHSLTPATSLLFDSRPGIAERNFRLAEDAILAKDFQALSEIIMKDSNQMHAIMLDTWPPVHYMNSTSWSIVDAIEDMNAREGTRMAAYTFDAGPNAHIITERKNRGKVISLLSEIVDEDRILETRAGDGPSEVKGMDLIDGYRPNPPIKVKMSGLDRF